MSFCAEPRLAARLRRGFPASLNSAPALLPGPASALRQALERWFREEGVAPRLVAEIDDAALVKVAASDGLGFFALPTLVAPEAVTRYGVRILGHAARCRQQFYAISVERHISHPAIIAITTQAQSALSGFARSGNPRSPSGRRPPRGRHHAREEER